MGVPLIYIYVVILVGLLMGRWWTILLLLVECLMGTWFIGGVGGGAQRRAERFVLPPDAVVLCQLRSRRGSSSP